MRFYLKKQVSILLAVIVCCSILAASETVNVEASTAKWKKACKAYNTWLSKNESKFNGSGDASKKNNESYTKAGGFLLVDLNKDGVPELVISHPVSARWDDIYVYTFKSGKVTQIKGVDGKKGKTAAIEANTQANGSHTIYKCKKNHLHVWSGGGWWENEVVYTVTKGKLKIYARRQKDTMMGSEFYEINGKNVSAGKYQSSLKKCDSSNYLIKGGLHSNTKANRKKYLK